ncbi:hypothetical protein [Olleya sp. UBA1516]|uniref:hypothetical protein n=1 Tax=Olleya sp. UBA1516 TaxID=1947013 RepID=UPI0025E5437C|nr:hypothetical protein [Olleya sp. UBA1516]|tara:strand:+ start:1305 stop:1817 length:513 start_codon:yes stop_codon:yes gene_type:complete
MKTIFKILIVALILISSNTLTAQTFEAQEESQLSGFDTQASQENFLLNQSASNLNSASTNNAIFIAQIGDNNEAVSVTRSTQSNINIIQNGNDNLTVLDINSTKLVETVIQNGDNNTVFDYSPFKTDIKNTTINQTGNNQNLTMFGSNSLSEKIKISMQGQDQSIIIRNF